MRKDWKYILYITLAFGLFVAVKLLAPKQYDWTVTFSHEDKNPYGAFALSVLLPTIFPPNSIKHSYESLYEIKDSLKRSGNILVITNSFTAGKEDTDALLNHVSNGGTAFISAQHYWGHFADTLKISTYDYFFKDGNVFAKRDTSYLRLVNPQLDTIKRYYFTRDNIHTYFNRFDTTKVSVVATNDLGNPITLRFSWGKGYLLLNSTPLAFTNIYLLSQNNHQFISETLSYLPNQSLEWTEFYHLGRMEASTPLRFILMNSSLRWAYYLSIITLLIFMAFEMKRKQRVIPIIQPLRNTTLEFVNTIGNLYYQNKEHKSIAEKKIAYFFEIIRSKYWLSTVILNDHFVESLTRKSGKSREEVQSLLKLIQLIQGQKQISSSQLMELNSSLEKFNK